MRHRAHIQMLITQGPRHLAGSNSDRALLHRPRVCGLADLTASSTSSICPYKGITSQYWCLDSSHASEADVAWVYDQPLRPVGLIAGLVANALQLSRTVSREL
jgi:hypothetical protein